MKRSTRGLGAVRTPAAGAWHVESVTFFALHNRSDNSAPKLFGALSLLVLAAVGCESQGAVGESATSISTKRSAVVDDFVREGVRLQEAALMAGSGAEYDLPLEVARRAEMERAEMERAEMERAETAGELFDADAGVDPFAAEATLGDDSVRCGDGELGEDELCDVAITEGEGACPTSCDPAPGCPEQTLILRTCWTRCATEVEPAPEGC